VGQGSVLNGTAANKHNLCIISFVSQRSCRSTVYYNDREFTVNSYHTLSIKLAHGNTIVFDTFGNTEAWIDGNVAGVTWHPERMTQPWLPAEINNLLYGIQNTNNGLVRSRQNNSSK